jgi:hypothetical protein
VSEAAVRLTDWTRWCAGGFLPLCQPADRAPRAPRFSASGTSSTSSARPRKLSPETIAARCGFKRSAWFEYRKKGSIPFNLFERVAELLEVKLQLRVITELSGGLLLLLKLRRASWTTAKRLARLFEEVPEEQLEAAFGAAFTAARTAIRELPFAEPSAEHKRASRGRNK